MHDKPTVKTIFFKGFLPPSLSGVVLAAVLLATACGGGAADPVHSAWAVYWEEESEPSLVAAARPLKTLRLFAAHFQVSGTLVMASPWVRKTLARLRRDPQSPGRRLTLTLVNDVETAKAPLLKDPEVIRRVLGHPERRRAHIAEIVDLSDGFDGVDIDYERVPSALRDDFTAFIRELSAALHDQGRRLTVVVEPKTEEVSFDGPGSADWAAIAQAADRLLIMAYFRHHAGGPAGPLAPAAWVESIVQFALTLAPAEKIGVALCVDAIDWTADGQGQEITYRRALARRDAYGSPVERPGPDASPRFTYTREGKQHQVWFEDRRSLNEKVKRLRRLRIAEIGFWRLGTGDPAFWKGLEKSQSGTEKVRK